MDLSAVWISMKTASLSVAITFILGIIADWAVVSIRNEKIKGIVDGILTLPLVLPPTVVGFLLLYINGVNRPLGRWLLEWMGVKIVFNWSATVVAAVVISLPLMYRSARGAFEQVDQTLIYAARL